MKIKKLFLAVFVTLGIFSVPVFAATNKLELTDATIISKSSTATAAEPVFAGNTISSNISFEKQTDYAEFSLTLKNISTENFSINEIKDNLTDDYLATEYGFSQDPVAPDASTTVKVKLVYAKQAKNVQKVSLDNLEITIAMHRDDGTEEQVVINPTTGDNFMFYVGFSLLALIGLLLAIFGIKDKRAKLTAVSVVVLAAILLPATVLASEGGEAKIYFTNIDLVGEFETYSITIDPNNGTQPTVKQITYGNKIGDLPSDPSKDGYTFSNWTDGDGNSITPDTIITSPISVSAKYSLVDYAINYDLGDGTVATANPTSYNIETPSFDLNQPGLEGYSFSGWTGTGLDGLTPRVTVNQGTTGILSFKANYSPNENTSFTVTHRYANLNGGYDEYVEHLTGTTDTDVVPAFREQNGFDNPNSTSTLHIDANGQANLDYTYERTEYTFSIADRTFIDSEQSTPDGSYKYETPITVVAVDRPGYDFTDWSDGSTDQTHTFEIGANTTNLTPNYSARTDTPYTVYHQLQNLNNSEYTTIEEDTQHLTGTTGEQVTPATKSYEGFEAPNTQTKEISGAGNTTFTYQYHRLSFQLTLTDAEHINTDAASGQSYPYGTQITLSALDKEGHNFTGWSNGSTDREIIITIGAEPITIGPEYEANKYYIAFDKNSDEATGAMLPQEYTYGVAQNLNSNQFELANHIFNGWNTDPNGDGDSYTDGQSLTNITAINNETITLFAQWRLNDIAITFDVDGVTSTETVKYGEAFTKDDPSKEGATFAGWFTSRDGSGDKYEKGDVIEISAPSITLYAVFISTKCTVTFETNGGGNIDAQIVNRGEKATRPDTNPTVSGMNFVDWYTDAELTTIFNFDSAITKDTVIYAKYVEAKYVAEMNGQYFKSVQLAIDEAPDSKTTVRLLTNVQYTSAIDMFNKNTSKSITLDLNNFKITNNKTQVIKNKGNLEIKNGTLMCGAGSGAVDVGTDGSFLMNSGSIIATGDRQAIYNDGGTVEIGGTAYLESNADGSNTQKRGTVHNIKGTLIIKGGTIVSVRDADSYAVSVYAGNLTIGVRDNAYDKEKIVIKGNTNGVYSNVSYPIYDGIMKGAVAAVNDESLISDYESGSTKFNDTEEIDSAIYQTLYYRYVWKVTLNAGTGSVSPNFVYVDKKSAIGEIPKPTPASGKIFENWYTSSSGGTLVDSTYVPTSNTTIYARYTDVNLTVSFNTNGGSDIDSQTVKWGLKATKPTDPTNGELYFENWYTDPEFNEAFSFDTRIYANTELFAKWVTCPADKICYKGNGATEYKMSPVTTASNSTVKLRAPNYKREGYGFLGWSETQNPTLGVDKIYGPMEDYVTGDLTELGHILYAVWLQSSGNLQSWSGCDDLTAIVYESATGSISYTANSVVALTDTRDNNTYAVARLSDGKCWMIENLRLDDSAAELTNENTNYPTASFKSLPATASKWCDLYDDYGCIETSYIETSNSTGNGTYAYGNYYDWYAATAGNGGYYSTNARTVLGDICPAGWHMPYGGFRTTANGGNTAGGFYYLYNILGSGASVWRAFPNNFVLNGWKSGSVLSRGSLAYYWSSTPRNTGNRDAYINHINSSNKVLSDGYSGKAAGLGVRCVASDYYTVTYDITGATMDDPVIRVAKGDKIETLPIPTSSTNMVFAGWYTESDGGTKVEDGYQPSNNVTLYAHWEESKACDKNNNRASLASSVCTENVNVTINNDTQCKRATRLHKELCTATGTCSGYDTQITYKSTQMTHGSCGEQGTLTSGDAFTCDVNGDGEFDELYERFYYVSDYYDTSSRTIDDSIATLIYYNNTCDGEPCNVGSTAYYSGEMNHHGPSAARSQLPTTSQWTNVSLYKPSRQILAENGATFTRGGTLPTAFDYNNYAARLITAQELNRACGVTVGNSQPGELNKCKYMLENTNYASGGGTSGFWLETPLYENSYKAWMAYSYSQYTMYDKVNYNNPVGTRPVIEVPKNKMSY